MIYLIAINVLILLAIGGIILTVGDIIFKSWVEKPHTGMYVLGLAVYLIGLMFLVQTFKVENIAVASTIFVILNITTLLLVSWFYFDEKLSLVQLSGIALAFVAILLLELGK